MMSDYLESLTKKLNLKLTRNVPQILQSESSECGLACLAMISHYYGQRIDLFNLRSRYGISSRGATLDTLINIAENLGMKMRALTLDIHEIGELKTPCILHWNMNHFVVLIKSNKKQVVIHDPASGRKTIGIKSLSNHFTGVALEIWPNSEFVPIKEEKKLHLSRLLNNVVGLKNALLKILFFSLIIEAITLLIPVGTQLVMDHVIPASDYNLLAVICLGLFFLVIFRSGISIFRAWVSIVTGASIDIQWKSGLFNHLIRLPVSYFEKRQLGDIQARFSSLDTIRSTFTENIVTSVMDGIMSVGVFIMMWLYGGWLVWVVMGFTLIYIILRIYTYPLYKKISEEQMIKNASANSHFMESLYSISTLKALGIIESRSQRWVNLNAEAINSGIRLSRLDMMFTGINYFITVCDQIIILWLGATAVIDNSMTLGMFVAFNAYRGQFSERSVSLIDIFFRLKMLSLHNTRVSDIVLSETEKQMPERNLFPSGVPVNLEIRNLYYQYDILTSYILKNVNMNINAGESVAIIGPSGMGKTTLLKLMAGLLLPSEGNVLVNGLDIGKIGVNNYRKCISCVLQDDKLLSGSIAENISGFEQRINLQQVEVCARLSHIHEDITSMPMGYETLVGELGGNLSGGQKQRLLIARALYRKPLIIFMDEATSHLDVECEEKVNQSISQLNITRIIIAHRPSTISSADRVIDLGKLL
ncbi:peptidase domain-containing ABC transporter [Xenorhabdus eapokensis]|uniref:RTX toxin n=1 Tax=Xenorhabdus eapokensis TaxID=1873482 RepID=A0A1Q5TGZ9_9GAMM|nr:peptidase domain-containing ABC transporter [Xenorhabdus eapokensis]OKO99481.1 RTX toxin [Xenorhabdus eapokensis]